MSGPPPEAVKQADGTYLLCHEDGSTSRYSKRPDGSWRKPERVRAGYVGDLEQEKYVPGEGLKQPTMAKSVARHRPPPNSGPAIHFNDEGVEECRAMIQASLRAVDHKAEYEAAKKDMQEAEAAKIAERAEAARAEASETQWEAVTVTLAARPFGLVPKAEVEGATGYSVLRATEGKPAWAEGVRPGWRLATVGGQDVQGLPLADVQARMKESAVPLELGFERPPAEWHFCVACMQPQPPVAFSRKMLTKPPEKRRCSACLEEAT
eukprot:TRINITY_DN14406_c0_g1_i1.p1 TRINITY_DN14406_c0_g1~~TRINITY_DN14406_c0_g1_i1.p1  ORF type:complete len:283 (-),score=52.59 TRINITY_DN14406_c0_g1_i1:147-941(-)